MRERKSANVGFARKVEDEVATREKSRREAFSMKGECGRVV